MSRNSEYQFISTDTAEIEALGKAAYERICGVPVRDASPERLFIAWYTAMLLHNRVETNWTGNQNIPSRAEGKNLDALGELFYTHDRPQATTAYCTVRFTISQAQSTTIIVPSGTRVTDAGNELIWETREDAVVQIGDTWVDVPVYCQTPGTVGNDWDVGTINTIVDLFDYYHACQNITASDGGSDEMDDDTFYETMRLSMDAYSVAGAVGAYEYWAKSVSTEIADVAAVRPKDLLNRELPVYEYDGGKYAFIGGETLIPDSLKVYAHGSTTEKEAGVDYTATYQDCLLTITLLSGGSLASASSIDVDIDAIRGGQVRIFVLMNDGTAAGEEIKAAVQAACSEKTVRPLTDFVSVEDPETVNYNIRLTYYLPAESAKPYAEIQRDVTAAVEKYKRWQSAKLGRDINPSYLIGLLMQTGIKRVTVTYPTFRKMADGSNNVTPQLARLGTTQITNGGPEDE